MKIFKKINLCDNLIIIKTLGIILMLCQVHFAFAQKFTDLHEQDTKNNNNQQLLEGQWIFSQFQMVDEQNQPLKDFVNMTFENKELPMFPDQISINDKNIKLQLLTDFFDGKWTINDNKLQITNSDTEQSVLFYIVMLSKNSLVLQLPPKSEDDIYRLNIVFIKK